MVDVQIERPTTTVTDDAAALADPGVSLERGVAALREALKTMPASAGVYCMRDRHEKPLYVGKAKSLRKRGRDLRQRPHPARPPATHDSGHGIGRGGHD